MNDEGLLTIAELQKYLRVCDRTIRSWCQAGMPYHSGSRAKRFRMSEVLEWTRNRRPPKHAA